MLIQVIIISVILFCYTRDVPQHGTSLGCGGKRWTPDVKDSCDYIK